jgi:hypothetical protein
LFETYGLGEEFARLAWVQASGRASLIDEFAVTPGRAGRAMADSLMAFTPRRLKSFGSQTPDFQT